MVLGHMATSLILTPMPGPWEIVQRIRESLFFIPTLVLLGCAVVAGLALWADDRGSAILDGLPLLSTTAAGGRAIASTVAGATITVAAIVFSVTALSTQMASSQYSPRALGSFLDDRFQQFIIGLVVGTFTYSLLILAGLSDVLPSSAAELSLSITLGVLLGVASAIGIVGYIDHSLGHMQIDSVVRRIAMTTVESIRHHRSDDREHGEMFNEGSPTGDHLSVESRSTGWVQGIDASKLIAALPPGATARVDVGPGEAVSKGDSVITLWAGDSQPDNARLRSAIRITHKRSISADPGFGIRLMVDIALRALSPGVNDPTTAVDVIHHLKIPLREILVSAAPDRVVRGPDNRTVYLPELVSRADYVHAAFTEIRLMASSQPHVLEALISVLEDLERENQAGSIPGRVTAIAEQLDLALETARGSGMPEPDLRRLLGNRRYEERMKQGDHR